MHENFFHDVKVYYEDTDAGGVVYYANYLKYLERARTEALSTIGLSNIKIKDNYGELIIVKSCNIEFKKSAKLEDELKIRSFVKSVTKTSFFMNQFIVKGDSTIVEAQVHLVFVNEKGKPVKVPETIFDNCLKFYKKNYDIDKKFHFKHGECYILPNNITLIPCYHPSPRNVNTKLISEKMMVNLFKKAKKLSTI